MSDDHTSIVAAEVAVEPRREHAADHDDDDLAPLVNIIVQNKLSPEAMAQLQWVREMQKDHATDMKMQAFVQSMVQMKADPEFQSVIAHDMKVAFKSVRYSYTSLPKMVQALTPVLCKYGLTISWIPQYDGVKQVGITCRLYHAAGHFEEAFIPSSLTHKDGMSNAQEVVGTQTTLKRHTLLSLLGIATGDMEPEPRQENSDKPAPWDKVADCLGFLSRKCGVDKEEAEQYMEKKSTEWTVGDLRDLCTWAKNRDKVEP